MRDQLRILIIEDEWLLARNISRYLERKGFLVTAVTSAAGATQMLLERKPDIVLIDIRLPDINGIEYCRYLRTCIPNVHIVVMSGRIATQDQTRLQELGVDRYLTKPFSLADMTDALDYKDGTQPAPPAGGSKETVPTRDRDIDNHDRAAPLTAKNRVSSSASTMQRLLIYSHDTYGLGNMRRMTAIAEHLVKRNPKLSVLMVSGSNALPAFSLPERIDYVKLPCLARDAQGNYDAKVLQIGLDHIIELRGNLILSTMLDFRPDMILVDKKPFGVSNELKPVLEIIGRRTYTPRLVLLLRDILDDPQSTREVWERNGYHDAIERYYDAVLVVGDPRVFDLGLEYAFPTSTTDRLRYCGYIRKSDFVVTSDPHGREPLVLVTPGGGEDGAYLIDTYIESLADSSPSSFKSLVFLGPELPENKVRDLQRSAKHRKTNCRAIAIRRLTTHMADYMNKARVLVTMAGYNTVSEGLSLAKPMIVIPRTKPSKEQEIRAQRLSRMGHLKSIHPSDLTPAKLFSAVNDAIHTKHVCTSSMNFDGLQNVNEELMSLYAGNVR